MGLLLPRQEPAHPVPSRDVSSHSTQTVADSADYCTRRLAGLAPGPAPDIGPGTAATIWCLVAAATAFLGVRIYCKIWRSRGLWWDDLVLILSWTMFLASSTMCQLVINLGFGKYPCDISPQSNVERITLEGGGLGGTFTVLAMMWSKTSFGITILRLTHDRLRVLVLVVVVGMNVAMCLQAVFIWVKCNPVEKNWLPSMPGTCWDLRVSNGYAILSGVLSGVCDLFLALLPWKLVWGKLKMRRKEKLGVVIAMSMGVFTAAMAFFKSARLPSMGGSSFTHDGCYLLAAGQAEIATTIMATCIPVLRVFLRDLRAPTPVEINGSGPRRRSSNTTAEMCKEVTADSSSPVLETEPPDHTVTNVNSATQLASGSPPGRMSWTTPKRWASSLWDFDKNKSVNLNPVLTSTTGSEDGLTAKLMVTKTARASCVVAVDDARQAALGDVGGEALPQEEQTRVDEVAVQINADAAERCV